MTESNPETRTRLALDTDWLTAVMATFALLILLGAMAGSVRGVAEQSSARLGISLRTVGLALVCIWPFITIHARLLRLGFALFGIASGSKALLYFAHVSLPAQMQNAQVMRMVEIVACLCFVVYIVHWFRTKIRYV